ncbi:MAG: LysM peptidoglycan-binding domain-containing protein [Candidatus Hydrothermales bacterium]
MKKLFIILSFTFSLLAQEKLTEEKAKAQIVELQNQIEKLKESLNSCQKELEEMKKELLPLDNEITSIQNEINSLKNELAKYPSEYEVKRGDFLAKIAAYPFIYGTHRAWPRIWRANRDLIKNPDLIYPGWKLKIPHGLDKTYTVIKGDYLWKIAAFWWIYRDGRKWKAIYEANKDKIKDPNIIYPGQEFIIPR